MWTMGFAVSLASAVLALLLFFAGYRRYRYVELCGNPVVRVTQVFVAAARKWKVDPSAKEDQLFEVDGPESAIKGSRKILHTQDFR